MKKLMSIVLAALLCLSAAIPALAVEDMTTAGEMRTFGHYGYIDGEGGLWLWGQNDCGQVGAKSETWWVEEPTRVMENVVSFSRCGEATIVLKKDGSVWTFGRDFRGAIDGDYPIYNTKNQAGWEPIKRLDGCVAVSIGNECQFGALKADGSLWVWGYDIWNCLGFRSDELPANEVSGLYVLVPHKLMDGVKSFAMGHYNGAALKTDGSLWWWGGDEWYEKNANGAGPQKPFKLMDSVKQFSIDNGWVGVVLKDGTAWSWGGTDRIKFSQRKKLTDGAAMIVGLYSGRLFREDDFTDYAYVLKTDGTLYGRDGKEWLMRDVASVYTSDFGGDLTLILKKDGTLIARKGSRKMPYSSTEQWKFEADTIIARNVPLPGQSFSALRPSATGFSDVSSDDYFAEAVQWAKDNNITQGTGETTFSPQDTVTRGQAVTFLWRLKKEPEPKATVNPFTDVKKTDYYYKAVLWAWENGITNGAGDTEFRPLSPVTRGQMITFLWRAQGRPGDTGSAVWYADAEKWAKGKNLLAGTAEAYATDAACPRADVVYYLWRMK